MIGELPTALTVNGVSYDIRADFRNVLQILLAYKDPELTDDEMMYICLKRMYVDFESIPPKDYVEAYQLVIRFIECNAVVEKKHSPRLVDWEKDEPIIFPAINKSAGMEVRSLPFLHWWTFMGHFQSIDSEGLFGYVMLIREKRAKGKKLEKHEREFLQANMELCRIDSSDKRTAENAVQATKNELADMFNSLLKDGGE